MKKFVLTGLFILALILEGVTLELPALFKDNMVLQRNTQVTIWGNAEPEGKVSVKGEWGAQAIAMADQHGSWSVQLQTPSASGPYSLAIQAGNEKINLENVLIGEVWLCSGQSNMEMPLKGWPPGDTILNSEKEIRNADYTELRFFTVEREVSFKPLNECNGMWEVCKSSIARDFSATAYFFGRKIHRELEVPVGLIHSSWGGTPAEAWTRGKFLEKVDGFQSITEKIEKSLPRNNACEEWVEKQKAKDFKNRPDGPLQLNSHTPTVLYNGMIHPLIPYTIKGSIWYQGEGNTSNPDQYHELFSTMIRNWRSDWDIGKFPFYFVQIAPYAYGENTKSQILREEQLKTLSLPNTGMAVTMDIGNPQNIHPANKQDVGKRLALWALANDYGRDIVCSGPLYDSMNIKGNKIYISFRYKNGGLMTKDEQLRHFEIAGPDGKFVEAIARIQGKFVVVSSPEVEHPRNARYAWGNTVEASLFNKEGLPSSPFNTENWDK